jgi:hypothetical protein
MAVSSIETVRQLTWSANLNLVKSGSHRQGSRRGGGHVDKHYVNMLQKHANLTNLLKAEPGAKEIINSTT